MKTDESNIRYTRDLITEFVCKLHLLCVICKRVVGLLSQIIGEAYTITASKHNVYPM
jgi:hypothetical protein